MKQVNQRTRRGWATLVALALCLGLFTGCGASSSQGTPAQPAAQPESQAALATDTGEGSASITQALPENRKIILNAQVRMETTAYDETCQALRQAAADVGGYLERSSQETPSYEGAARWSEFVFRVPAERYEDFLHSAQDAGNVTSLSEGTEDVTAQYVDVEARIAALTTQQQSLMDMMAQASDLDTLLAIQDQLADVQYELERYEGQKRVYDDQVTYSTITVTVEEVVQLTQKTDTFAQRLGAAFTDGWRDFASGLQGFVVSAVYLMPLLLIVAAVGIGVALAVRRSRKRAPMGSPRTPAQYGPAGPGPSARADRGPDQKPGPSDTPQSGNP